jgi:hypothetical protein
MTSSFTTNKSLEKPANGDYVDNWNVPVNGDMDVIDQSFGGVTSLNATAGSATLTASQYRSLIVSVAGAISGNVVYTIPSGVGGQWIVYNSTTDSSGGPWTVTFASGGGGTFKEVQRNSPTIIYSNGADINSVNQPTPGSNTELIYNGSGSFAASPLLTWDGTTLAASALTVVDGVVAGTSVSDSIGNLRTVPSNPQSTSYTLVATDSGKFINITTGGVVVPSGVFSAGQSVTIYNNSSSTQTITQSSGVTMYQVGSANTGNRSLAQRGLCTVFCVGTNSFVITGGGLF